MFTYLTTPNDERIPNGYRLIFAYTKGDEVVVPIESMENLSDEQHDCDWERCGSMSHVVRFSVSHKYGFKDLQSEIENLQAENDRLKAERADSLPL